MSNDARFEFVLVDGGEQPGSSPAPVPSGQSDLEKLIEKLLTRQGFEYQPPEQRAPQPSPVTLPQTSQTAPTQQKGPVEPARSQEIEPPTIPDRPASSPTSDRPVTPPAQQPVTAPEKPPEPKPTPPIEPKRPPESVAPKVEPQPPPSTAATTPTQPEAAQAQPPARPGDIVTTSPTTGEERRLPERFADYPDKEPRTYEPRPVEQAPASPPMTAEDVKAEAEDIARAEQDARMKSFVERYNADREARLEAEAAKRKAEHDRAMAAADTAQGERRGYEPVDVSKMFQEMRAESRAKIDKALGIYDKSDEVIHATLVDAAKVSKDGAAATAAQLSSTAARVSATGSAAASTGATAAGGAAGFLGEGALAAAATSAGAATVAGIAVAAPFMAYNSLSDAASKLARSLEDVSPDIAAASAEAEANATLRRIEAARRLGPDLARMTAADDRFREAFQDISLPFARPIIKEIANIKQGIADAFGAFGDVIERNGGALERITEELMRLPPFDLLSGPGELGELLSKFFGKENQPTGYDALFASLDFITPPGWNDKPILGATLSGGNLQLP